MQIRLADSGFAKNHKINIPFGVISFFPTPSGAIDLLRKITPHMNHTATRSRLVAALAAFFLLTQAAFSQDVIQKKNGEKINGKVLEIGLIEIRYVPQDNPEGPVISITKDEVLHVEFENGTHWKNTPDPYDVNLDQAVLSKNRALKVYPFSILFANLAVGYEQHIQPGMSVDLAVGWIGPRIGESWSDEKPAGAFIKIGPRFRFGPDFKMRGMQHSHHLQGSYLMPQFCFSMFNTNLTENGTSSPFSSTPPVGFRYQVTAFALNLVYGKQLISANSVVFDYHFGIGFGLQSRDIPTDRENFDGYCFSHLYAGPGAPITFEIGIAIGGLLQ